MRILLLPIVTIVLGSASPASADWSDPRPSWFQPVFVSCPEEDETCGGSLYYGWTCRECTMGSTTGTYCIDIESSVLCGATEQRCVTQGESLTIGVSIGLEDCGFEGLDGAVEFGYTWSVQQTICRTISAGDCQICRLRACWPNVTLEVWQCSFSDSTGRFRTFYRSEMRFPPGGPAVGVRCRNGPEERCFCEQQFGKDCGCESADPPQPAPASDGEWADDLPDPAEQLPADLAEVLVVLVVGDDDGDRVISALTDFHLLELSMLYEQLVHASASHDEESEVEYLIVADGLSLASGPAAEVASLLDQAASERLNGGDRGDLDFDGDVDASDLVRFIEALDAMSEDDELRAAADIDANGALDPADLGVIIEEMGGS